MIECPEHMKYSECLTKCSKYCQNLNDTDTCHEPDTCIEGCQCVDNYFWDQDKAICISREECEELINKNIEEGIFARDFTVIEINFYSF